MKMLRSFTSALVILCPLWCFAAPAVKPLDRIVAIVNHDIITQSQLDKQILLARQQLTASNTPIPNDKALQKQVLDKIIDEKIQMQQAKSAGIEINQKLVDRTIADIAKRNNLTPAQLKHEVETQGMNFQQYEKMIRKQMLISKLQEKVVGNKLSISKTEVDKLLKHTGQESTTEYQIGDILITVSEDPSASEVKAAQEKANQLIKKLKQGANFAALAVTESSDESVLNGGDLGWRAANELPDVFVEPVRKLKINEVAGPIRTANGFHIIKLIATRSKVVKGKMTRAQAQEIVYQRKINEALGMWLRHLRANAYIKKFV